MNSYIFAAVVLYTAWAIYSGYKYVNGRYQWLEQPEICLLYTSDAADD